MSRFVLELGNSPLSSLQTLSIDLSPQGKGWPLLSMCGWEGESEKQTGRSGERKGLLIALAWVRCL